MKKILAVVVMMAFLTMSADAGPRGGTRSGKTGNSSRATGNRTAVSEKAAEPKTRSQSGTWSNARGKSGTSESTVTRTGKNRDSKRTWTGQEGKTATYENSSVLENKARTSNGTFTGPDGKTYATQGTTQWLGSGTVGFDRSATGQNGKTLGVTGTRQRTGNTLNTQKTYTGPNGKETTVNGVTEVQKGAVSTDWTTEKGTTYSHDTTYDHEGADVSRDSSWSKTPATPTNP